MKNFQHSITLFFLMFSLLGFSQERPATKKVKVTGRVIDKTTNQPLEYTTVTFQNPKNPSDITGGITDAKGEFEFNINAGVYDVKVEFISFKVIEMKGRNLQQDTNLGSFALVEDATMLNAVEVRQEVSTVSMKLDKKVYNVGQDMIVRGGTVSDVLDNVPSVSVDSDGTVSLRGNESVRILIDGRPSNAINMAEALRQIPADAIDKVEIITNPSARYDAEGGAGIINILLKKGKNQGINGVVTATVGDPETYGITGTVNFKNEKINLFTTQGYNYRTSPGNSMTDTEYLSPLAEYKFIDERRNNERVREGYNGSFGFDWFLDETTTWTHIFSYRNDNGDNPENTFFYNYDSNRNLISTRNRSNTQISKGENVEYSTNFIKKFKKDGHQLTFDGNVSLNKDDDKASILDNINTDERTFNNQKQTTTQLQADYVLPIKENSRFEAGYRGSFTENIVAFQSDSLNVNTNQYDTNFNLSNDFEYKENVNALYTQFGSKISKFSYLFGLRWEDSKINVNQLSTADYNAKKYNNFFPSAFLTYEISDETNISLSYSRRIQRPRGRFLNPFQNRSSDINIFQGNPDLDPAMTDAFDLGYLKKWKKITLSTSAYFNRTKDVFQFVRRENGEFSNGTPVVLSGPINLAEERRFGFEFTLNYNPFKWWRLNSNFNFFSNETIGQYNYVNSLGQDVSIDLDNSATGWFTRVNSKVTLPYKIEWQLNATYNAPQTNFQGKSLGVLSANMALSKDILKESATISLNVSDIFNSRKRINETNIANVLNSYSEMQWRERQINLSFTYRFNKKKNEKERQPRREGGDEGEFMGG
ncbi:outer membrane receptor protein involved in Fe transport [Flavobacterium arsenatis]|uniref:Outer membrane receptor protein involved in Fe transport n=1 Tax=Flavobacterium arsenatis TaxID=1484332 RepID=A0ABU1TTA0_9FLAO|nr:outer membrane beta-barrel family protein [Flavobacterium arsenatis]MDR6969097.1 outer membrane receptor protein involved in Fe transport [Flavobacterium arsenatis]